MSKLKESIRTQLIKKFASKQFEPGGIMNPTKSDANFNGIKKMSDTEHVANLNDLFKGLNNE